MMSQNERINSLPLILQHSSLKFLFNQMGRSIDVVNCFFPQPLKTKNKTKTNQKPMVIYRYILVASIYMQRAGGWVHV